MVWPAGLSKAPVAAVSVFPTYRTVLYCIQLILTLLLAGDKYIYVGSYQ